MLFLLALSFCRCAVGLGKAPEVGLWVSWCFQESMEYLPFFPGSSCGWMWGTTPPSGIMTDCVRVQSSSSPLIASIICLGCTLFLLFCRAALPDSSSTSAHRYSSTAARYTLVPQLQLYQHISLGGGTYGSSPQGRLGQLDRIDCVFS